MFSTLWENSLLQGEVRLDNSNGCLEIYESGLEIYESKLWLSLMNNTTEMALYHPLPAFAD